MLPKGEGEESEEKPVTIYLNTIGEDSIGKYSTFNILILEFNNKTNNFLA